MSEDIDGERVLEVFVTKKRSMTKADKRAVARDMKQLRIEMLVETMILAGVDELVDSNEEFAGLLLEGIEAMQDPVRAAKMRARGQAFFADLRDGEDDARGSILGVVDSDGNVRPHR